MVLVNGGCGIGTGWNTFVPNFEARDLVARVRALMRRASGRVMPAAAWAIDEAGHRIAWRDRWLPLTPQEFRMLRLLLSRPGRVFSRAQLLDSVQTELRDVSDRAIDSHVKNLRRKIQAVEPEAECITSVYGVGYRFDPPESD